MKRELRDRWVAALRSGEYEQGQGDLRTPEGSFCCLGVLCEVTPEIFRRQGTRQYEALVGGEWSWCDGNLGFDGEEAVGLGNHQSELVELNDTERAPFAVIADWIEANVQVED